MNKSIFYEKDVLTFYVPNCKFEEDLFVVELLDLSAAYLEPLSNDISMYDIKDYFNNYTHMDFLDFLFFKRYVSDEKSFLDLAKRYSESNNEFYEIVCKNTTYDKIQALIKKYSISELVSLSACNENSNITIKLIKCEEI